MSRKIRKIQGRRVAYLIQLDKRGRTIYYRAKVKKSGRLGKKVRISTKRGKKNVYNLLRGRALRSMTAEEREKVEKAFVIGGFRGKFFYGIFSGGRDISIGGFSGGMSDEEIRDLAIRKLEENGTLVMGDSFQLIKIGTERETALHNYDILPRGLKSVRI